MSSKDWDGPAPETMSRRKFLHYCSAAVLITASYQVISVFGESEAERGDTLGSCWGCRFKCTGNCVRCGNGPCAVVRGLWA
jgi:hypothetical protein